MNGVLKKGCLILIGLAALAIGFKFESQAVINTTPTWYVDARCFSQGATGAFDQVAVKDPSIVYYNGKYHMYYTGVTSAGYWQMGYASATTIEGLKSSKHTFLSKLSEGYFCAPQVFYFEPHQKWYMIYNDGIYGAAYATTTDVSDPDSWSGPYSLGLSSPTGYDFWIICDDQYAYLYNTKDGGSIYKTILYRKTTLANFPTGWSEPETAVTDSFEGVCVYKSLADGKYYMLPEDYLDNRYYELWTATDLSGPWTQVAEKWASQRNLKFNADHWTDHVSHGELIRAGYNQKLEINDIKRADFLIQGVVDGTYPDYAQIPWEIGLIRNYKASITPTPTASASPTPVVTPTPSATTQPTATTAPTGCTVSYTQNDWGSGATVNITITNNGTSSINGWKLAWNFAGNQKIGNLWNGSYTQNDTAVIVTNLAYNSTIPAGKTVSFGFNLSYSGNNVKPASFTLNGTTCQVL